MNRFWIIAAVMTAMVSCSRGPEDVAGGGTEDGNVTVTGFIAKNGAGEPAGSTQVMLVPSDFNPVTDSVPTGCIDTTDADGRYVFTHVTVDSFNITAVHITARTRVAVTGNGQTGSDTVYVPTDTLRATGRIRVPYVSNFNTNDAFIYLAGTPYQGVNAAGAVLLDSLPGGLVPALTYGVRQDPLYRNRLADTVQVAAGQELATDTVFYCRAGRAGTVPVIDGYLADWDSGLRTSILTPWGAGYFRFLYSDSGLYVGVGMADLHVMALATDPADTLEADDGFTFKLDPLFDKGVTPDTDDILFTFTVAGLFREGLSGTSQPAGVQVATTVSGTINDNTDRDVRTIIEVFIPWSVIGVAAPVPGQRMGAEIVINDRDRDDYLHHTVWANTNGGEEADPDGFGIVSFGD